MGAAAAGQSRTTTPFPQGSLIALGLATMAVPTFATLAGQDWTRESGEHQPIVLASGAWVLWRVWPDLRREGAPGQAWLTACVLAIGLITYVFGTAFDFVTLSAGGLYLAGLAALQSRFGVRALLKNWFPFVFLAFAVPPPSAWADRVTAPLKAIVSAASTGILHGVGLPVARQGVTIFVGQYQLLVEDACSGMNSLFGLTAISLLYIFLRRGPMFRYSLLMLAMAVPIAIAANIVRIMILILLTYFFGDAVAQSFLHFTAGLVLFAVALVLVFLIDEALFPRTRRIWERP